MVKILVKSVDELEYVAKRLADFLLAGDFLALDGELGAGKTTFVQGLAKGLEISEAITSPTFTIIKEYHEGKLPLYHMDVYRLEDPLEMENLGYEEYFYGDGVTVVEWAKLIEELWPEEYLKMEFSVLAEGRMLALEPVGDRYVTMVEELTGHDYSEC